MEPLGQHLQQNKDFQKRLDKIKRDTLANKEVKAFIEAHQSELTNAMIDRDLDQLQAFKDQSKSCENVIVTINALTLLKGMFQNYTFKMITLKLDIYHARIK